MVVGLVASLLAAASCAVTPPAASSAADVQGVAAYQLFVLAPPDDSDGGSTQACGINDAGQVAGGYSADGLIFLRGAIWDGGWTVADSATSQSWSINGAGHLSYTRSLFAEGVYRATLWCGEEIDLGIGSTDETSFALGLNDMDAVVGTYGEATQGHAFVWENSVTTTLPAFDGPSEASAINNAGQIVGSAHQDGVPVAVRWERVGEDWTVTPLAPGFSYAFAINDTGTAVGSIRLGAYTDSDRPALFGPDGPVILLDAQGQASAINSSGDIVGQYEGSAGNGAFLWHNGTVVDLRTLLPVAQRAHWELFQATGINDTGWITGLGLYDGQCRGFLLRPVLRTPQRLQTLGW